MLAVLLLLSHKPLAGQRPENAVPDALDWWLSQVLSSLVCGSNSTLHPLLETARKLSPHPSAIYHFMASGEVAKPLIPLRHRWSP